MVKIMEEKFRFSSNLRKIMGLQEKKPRDLKQSLKAVGVQIADPTLSNYLSESEHNVRTPKLLQILNIAKALKVKTGDLLGPDFLAHDAKVDDMTLCGDINFNSKFGLSNNVELFTVTDNSRDVFSTGDRLVIDKDETTVTAGYYVGVMNNKSQILKLANTGKAYSVEFSGNATQVSYDDLKITGKVVAKFTTQI
jgi:transcriptional regulator with XRE-family HTH domain